MKLSRPHDLRTGRSTRSIITAALALALLAGLPLSAGHAQTAPTVRINAPTEGSKLSMGRGDVAPTVDGFQTRVAGTAPANADIDVFAKRPGGAAAVVGTGKADSAGNWSVQVTLPAGEHVLHAVDKANANNPSPEVPGVFVVVRYIFTFYDSLNSAGNWVLIANPGDVPARADITIAGQKRGDTITIPSKEAVFPVFPGLAAGPVVVDSLDGVPLITTQRTTWSASDLEEVPGVYDGYLAKKSWFTWYDTRNSGGRDWIVVTNFGDGNASVTVSLAGIPVGAATIAVGASHVFHVANVVGGPILVDSDQVVLASRRTLWKPTNFTEITSIPDSWLSRSYQFTWYDSIGTGGADWVLVANPSSSEPADVTIQPPPNKDGSLPAAIKVTLPAGGIHVQDFPNTRNGPLTVSATIPVIATQRALWSNGNSFEEVAGIAPGDQSRIYFQSWYDTQNSIGDWMLQGNPLGQSATVAYTVAGPGINLSSSLDPLEVEFPLFAGKKGGPLTVTGNRSYLQSKRTLWGATADFMEITGIRGSTRTGKAKLLGPPNVTVSDFPNDDGTAAIVAMTPVNDESVEGYWVYRTSPERRRVAFVHRDADPSCAAGNPCIVDRGLQPGVAVTYEVTALSLNLIEGRVGTGTGTPLDDPPTAPAGLGATAGDRQVALNWEDNPESDVAGYHVYRRNDASQPPSPTVCEASNPANPALSTYTKLTTAPITTSDFVSTGLTNGTRYCFRVTAVDKKASPNESPASNPITGTPAASPPIVTVLFPNGGQVLRGDTSTTYDVTWEDKDADKDFSTAKIEFSENPNDNIPVWQSINDNVPNSANGKFTWDPPSTDADTVRIRVTATDQKGNSASDISDANFAIDKTDPVIDITAPVNGGTPANPTPPRFRGGETVNITWTATEKFKANNPVVVEYSLDNGVNYVAVPGCTNIPDNGACSWIVPNGANSSQAKVRVSVSDQAGHVGRKESVTIILDSLSPPAPRILNIEGSTNSPVRARNTSPKIEVDGPGGFSEAGKIRLFSGAAPTSCAAGTPVAARDTAANLNDKVIFNNPQAPDPNPEPNGDFALLNDGVNTFRVCMVDKSGNSSPMSEPFVYHLDRAAPSAPRNVAVSRPGATSATITWDAVNETDVAGYNVLRADDPLPGSGGACSATAEGGAFTQRNSSGLITSTNFVDATDAITTYCYKVEVVDVAGNTARSVGARSSPPSP